MLPEPFKRSLMWMLALAAVAMMLWPVTCKAEAWDLYVMRDTNHEHIAGDIISVHPAGGIWTGVKNDQSKNFLIIRVDGLTKDEAHALLEEEHEISAEGDLTVKLPRRYNFSFVMLKDSLPELDDKKAREKGAYQPFMENKKVLKLKDKSFLWDKKQEKLTTGFTLEAVK